MSLMATAAIFWFIVMSIAYLHYKLLVARHERKEAQDELTRLQMYGTKVEFIAGTIYRKDFKQT